MTLLVHTKPQDIEVLECIFATLTPQGWVIPAWLVELGYAAAIKIIALTARQRGGSDIN